MIEELINGFDSEAFCKFLRSKFASFSESHVKIATKNDFQLDGAAQLGIVKTLAGPNGSNLPLIVVAAKLADGEKLKERSSRLKQFKFAKQVLDQAMANRAPGVEGVITQGLFVFHDDAGNFRLSLVFGKAEGAKLVWSTAKRLSFHVEAGAGNKTFRDRMSLPWGSFDKLKEAFSVEKLTKEFYSRLFAWYQLALASDEVVFPNDVVKGKEAGEVKSEQIIRLITRLMFVWFLKQKHLVPDNLFDSATLKTILKDFKTTSGDNYYRGILQNLFFATLNSEIQEREFAVDAGRVSENKEHFGVKTLYRYGGEFAGSEKKVLKLFSAIPFLNGGLFECLDRDQAYYDGFSRNPKKRAKVPNHLFFDEPDGLIPLLQQYNFTVEENSPGDEEVALDPELLGKVFENLLGAYNPETKVAARNATGSFYTPREIVNYMVDESLIAYLVGKCGEEHAETVRKLFTDGERPADRKLCEKMDAALVTAKILDPACGSGAFPMGILLRMVELLRILRQIPEDDSVYDLKLELIENCIYGGDIQCIAVQISKLRFFISLVCEQKPTANAKDNYGIHTLPNLETKFVAADSLIALPKSGSELPMQNVEAMKKELWAVRHRHFLARSYQEKKDLRKEDKALREKLAKALEHGGGFDTTSAKLMSAWDPYDQNTSADFSDPEWMFNVRDGFDVVIGNPPYILLQNMNLHAEYYQQLTALFSAAQYKVDTYHLFTEKGINLLNSSGVLAFITPNTFFKNKHTNRLREIIVTKTNLCRVVLFYVPVFEDPSVDNVVFICRRSSAFPALSDHMIAVHEIRTQNFTEEVKQFRMFPQQSIKSPTYSFAFDASATDIVLLNKIEMGCKRLGEIGGTYFGVQTFDRKKHVSEEKHDKHWRPVIDGWNVSRFCLRQPREYLDYRMENVKSGGDAEIYQLPRIVVRQIGRYPEGTLCPRDILTLNTIYNIYLNDDNYNLKYVLGIINSSVIHFYWLKMFYDNKKTFPKIKKQPLELIPIRYPQGAEETSLINLVDRVLAAKQVDPAADTAKLEDEIDELVYDLYGLTPDEKKIVKESVVRGVTPVGVEGGEESDAGELLEPKKKPAKKRKAALPPSLPGWD